jgi:succinyl-diaminopimelate desuccinylase
MLLLLCACAAPRPKIEPLLVEVLRFPTVEGNEQARKDQQAWLLRTAASLGLEAREAGPVTEIELPGPRGAPVLGLVVHGDVQPVEENKWSAPPFAGVVRDGIVFGRGAADDKGPLVQALLAMRALRDAPRTHTLRLLVGSDEESGSKDIGAYLATHQAPDYSLVLDSEFPVVVGEKAWDGLRVRASKDESAAQPWAVVDLRAGISPSIVPDEARLLLRWREGEPSWDALLQRLRMRDPGADIRVELIPGGRDLEIVARGRAAHGGMNLAGGRNALVGLARIVEGELPQGGADDLLAFARFAGADLEGRSLGLDKLAAPGWGGWAVNAATIARDEKDGSLVMVVNLRRPPPLTGPASREFLFAKVRAFSPRLAPEDFYFKDEPLVFDPQAKMVRRLMDSYARVTGERPPPAISGGGTYANRIPRAIAFGMWFPGKPYPGHDVDEQISIADLERGYDVLLEALRDIATGPPLRQPFAP